LTDIRQNAAQPADPLGQLNDPAEAFKNPAQIEFFRVFLRLLRTALAKMVQRDQAATHVTLVSPGGKSYVVRVNETGALVTEYVRG
jgi:hypothetical protein